MIVSKEHRFVFVQTPKCASTSIKLALQQYQDYPRIARHATLDMILHHYPELREYRKFGVTRVTEDWRQSCYRWARRKQDHPVAHKAMTYSEYLESSYYPNWYHRDGVVKFLPPWHECRPNDWVRGCDRVVQFENLGNEWEPLLKWLGVPHKALVHMNRDKFK